MSSQEYRKGDRVRVVEETATRYVFPGHDFKVGDECVVLVGAETGSAADAREPMISRERDKHVQYVHGSQLERIPAETAAVDFCIAGGNPRTCRDCATSRSRLGLLLPDETGSALPTDTATPEETPVTENRKRTLNNGISREFIVAPMSDGGAHVTSQETYFSGSRVYAALTKAQARELALNLLIATGDAPAAPELYLDSYGDVQVDGHDSSYDPTSSSDTDTAEDAAIALYALVHGPRLVEEQRAVEKEAAGAAEREAGIEALRRTFLAEDADPSIDYSYRAPAERAYDAGVRAPETVCN